MTFQCFRERKAEALEWFQTLSAATYYMRTMEVTGCVVIQYDTGTLEAMWFREGKQV